VKTCLAHVGADLLTTELRLARAQGIGVRVVAP